MEEIGRSRPGNRRNRVHLRFIIDPGNNARRGKQRRDEVFCIFGDAIAGVENHRAVADGGRRVRHAAYDGSASRKASCHDLRSHPGGDGDQRHTPRDERATVSQNRFDEVRLHRHEDNLGRNIRRKIGQLRNGQGAGFCGAAAKRIDRLHDMDGDCRIIAQPATQHGKPHIAATNEKKRVGHGSSP